MTAAFSASDSARERQRGAGRARTRRAHHPFSAALTRDAVAVQRIKQHVRVQQRPGIILFVNVVGKCTDLAVAAISPGPAAASATAAAHAASPAAPAAAAPAAAAPATPGSDFFADLRRCSVFLVENVECRQADVRDFLLTEKDFVSRRGILRPYICGRSAG